MKIDKRIPIVLVAIVLSVPALSQNHSSAEKVYYTPIEEKIYYAIDINFAKYDDLNSEDGVVPNDVYKIDPECPIYKPNEDYKKGDVLRVLVEDYMDDDDLYSYIQIVGMVDNEIIQGIDSHLKERASALFGGDKLSNWPDEFMEDKGLRGILPNEKDVDSDYYILSSVDNFTPKIKEHVTGQEATLTKGDASNLVIFHVANIGGDEFAVKEIDNLTSSFYKIDIRMKEKKGKKGKKIGGTNVMDLTTEDKTVTDTFEKKIDTTGPLSPPIANCWEDLLAMSDDLVKMNNEYILIKVKKGIDKAFSKVK